MRDGPGVSPDRDQVLLAISDHRTALEDLGVVSLALFGSVARDASRPESDIDILVEVRRPMGAFQFIDIRQRLEQILQRKVDLVTPHALKPRIRSRVLSDAVLAFGSLPAA